MNDVRGTVLVQGQRIPSKSMTDSGEAGRLWLCPLNSHMLCSRTSNQVPRDVISWRGDTGALRTLHLSRTYQVLNTCHLECNVEKRRQTSTAYKATGLSPEEDRESRPWSEHVRGRCRGSHHQAAVREGMAFLHEASTCSGSALEQAASISGPVSSQWRSSCVPLQSHQRGPSRDDCS